MFCEVCGNQITGNEKFCPKCGTSLSTKTVSPQKKKKKPFLIILTVFIAIALFALSINLVDMFLINSVENLENKLTNTVWCSEPLESVAVDGSQRLMSAYTIEFHEDGTATQTVYMAVCPAYENLNESDLEVYEQETVEWEISGNRALEIDGTKFDYKAILAKDDSDKQLWYIKDDSLHLNRTYYDESQFDYAN